MDITERVIKQYIKTGKKVDTELGDLHLHNTKINVNIAKILIDAGANVNIRRIDYNNTPLHVQKNFKVIKLLIASGGRCKCS